MNKEIPDLITILKPSAPEAIVPMFEMANVILEEKGFPKVTLETAKEVYEEIKDEKFPLRVGFYMEGDQIVCTILEHIENIEL